MSASEWLRLKPYAIVYLPEALVSQLAEHIASHRPGDDSTRWLFEATPGQPPHQNTAAPPLGARRFTFDDVPAK